MKPITCLTSDLSIPIKRIIAKLPAVRQNLFFSATMPREIASLADGFLRNPVKVSVTPAATTVERITQRALMIEGPAKGDLLVELLRDPAFARTIVFTRTKRGADKVSRRLDAAGIAALAIHGNKSQNQRTQAMDKFKSGALRVMVATDIAARGIDVDGVTHVVNYELPDVPDAYVHRIGRTARAGADGAAVSLVDGSEAHLLRQIERHTRQSISIVDRRGTVTATRDAPAPETSQQQRPARGKPRNGSGRPGQGGDAPRGDGRAKNRGGARPNGPGPQTVWSNFGAPAAEPARRAPRRRNGRAPG